MSLFSELKRRNVFRIGAAYVIVAWLLMQVAALAVPALRLPEWVTTFVVFILLLGFPVALILAWAYEVTPEGIKKAQDVPLEQSVARFSGRKLGFLVIGLLAIAVTVLLVDRAQVESSAGGKALTGVSDAGPTSIAVLPFVNMSDDPEQAHFADGLTEEILNSLAAARDLDVVSRTSSFAFKGSNLSIAEISSQLNVAYVLEGSVRRAGDRIRVTAQLIESESDAHLWSRTFDRELTVDNILQIQEEVATTVARSLNARLTLGSRAKWTREAPDNLVALDRYHDGLHLVRRLELGDFEYDDPSIFYEAVEAFEASIAADPEWAPSHAELGRAHHFFYELDPERQLRLSRERLTEALRLDPDYGPAHASLGFVNMVEGSYEASFEALARAEALGVATNWLRAMLVFELGRFDDAVEQYRIALASDPLSVSVKLQLADTLYCTERYEELEGLAEELMRSGLDRVDRVATMTLMAHALLRTGQQEEAVRVADEAAALAGREVVVADTLALAGLEVRARAAINSVESGDSWWTRAPAAITLGDADLALDILEQAERDGLLDFWIRCSPEIRSLADNPRFDALIERLDLPE